MAKRTEESRRQLARLREASKDSIVAMLYKAHGVIAVAAKQLGVPRRKLSDRIHGDAELEKELEESRAELNDLLAQKLFSRIFRSEENGGCDAKCLMFALERLHPAFRPPQLMQQSVTVQTAVVRPDERSVERAKAIFREMLDCGGADGITQP